VRGLPRETERVSELGSIREGAPPHRYRKAWLASFPSNLWPAVEEETEDGIIFLKLKDGSRFLAYEPAWKKKPSSIAVES
jgi:hypothetical protein